jgi:hypothetical protein
MARTVYSYQKYTNVVGGKDVLSKLRTFAVAQGWTSEYYHTSVEWASDGDGTYSFGHVSDEDHCSLYSDGYGNQDLRYRFKVANYDAQSDRINCYGIDPNYPNVDDTISTEPHLQNDWIATADYPWMSVPASTFPEMILVGNDKFISVSMLVSTVLVLHFAIGTIELIPEEQSDTEYHYCWPTQSDSGGQWYNLTAANGYWFSPLYVDSLWLDGARTSGGTNHAYMLRFSSAGTAYTRNWTRLDEVVALNSFSGYRTLVSNPCFRRNTSTGVWRMIGHTPNYFLKWSGLAFGDIITRGSEEYIVVPTLFTNSPTGCAFLVS